MRAMGRGRRRARAGGDASAWRLPRSTERAGLVARGAAEPGRAKWSVGKCGLRVPTLGGPIDGEDAATYELAK